MDFYQFARGLAKGFCSMFYRIEVHGLHYIPESGGCIICSNHINNLDPIIIGTNIPRKMSYMAKEELFKNKLLGPILIKLGMFPVNRQSADISAIKNSLRVLNNNGILGIFPEGTRSINKSQTKAKPGLAMIAIKAKAPVIPVSIITDYKLFGKIIIKINPPILFEQYYDKKIDVDTYQSLSQEVMDYIENQTNLSHS